MVFSESNEEVLESYNFYSWPLNLRFGKVIITENSLKVSEGTWIFKTDFTTKMNFIIHSLFKDSIDYTVVGMGILFLILYPLIFTIPLGIAINHRGLQNQLQIGIEGGTIKKIYGPNDVMIRIQRHILSKIDNKNSNNNNKEEKTIEFIKVIICNTCGKENSATNIYCSDCGNSLSNKQICPSCKAVISIKDPFCSNCGNRIV